MTPLLLGGPETPPKKFLLRLSVAPLLLGQDTVPVLFFLQLILEFFTLLFRLSMEDN